MPEKPVVADEALSVADQQVVADEAAATVRYDDKADARFEASIADLPFCTQEVERQRRKA